MADQGLLTVNNTESVYEKVKKRKERATTTILNENHTKVQNVLKTCNDVFAADSDEEISETKVVAQTKLSLSPKKRHVGRRPKNGETKKRKQRIKNTVKDIFSSVMQDFVVETVDSSLNGGFSDHISSKEERISLTEESCLNFQEQIIFEKPVKLISTEVEEKRSTLRILTEAPIDWTIPSSPAPVNLKKDKTNLKPPEKNNVTPVNVVVYETSATVEENNKANNKNTSSPDLLVNIDICSNGSESSEENFWKNNNSVSVTSKSKEIQDVRFCFDLKKLEIVTNFCKLVFFKNCIDFCNRSFEKATLSKLDKLIYLKVISIY